MSNNTCTINGCDKPVRVKSRGWCSMHYAKWQRHGDPTAGRTYGTNPDTCTHDGCDRAYDYGGYCNMHYLRSRQGIEMSKPARRIIRDAEESFAARTRADGGCLVWTGARNEAGYGIQTAGGSRARKPGLAHRYAWERANGPIPDGMKVDHICWNPACVNVEHLRLASNAENVRYRKGPNSGRENALPRNVYRKRDKFRVQIVKDGKAHGFGVYETVGEADAVAAAARACLFGEFSGA